MAWALFTNLIPAVHSIFFLQKKDAIPIRAIRQIIFTFINFRLSLIKFTKSHDNSPFNYYSFIHHLKDFA